MAYGQFLETVSHTLRKPTRALMRYRSQVEFSVGDLSDALDIIFTYDYAESWDKNGLLVGNPAAPVTRIAIALDVTPEAIRYAHEHGANVLLTHHPVFLEAPDRIVPGLGPDDFVARCIECAISNQVALINIHTPLDTSELAHRYIPSRFGWSAEGIVEPIEQDDRRGYGHICELESPCFLNELARHISDVNDYPVTVWGNDDMQISRMVCATGSANGMSSLCFEKQIDCLICGEMKYHEAMSAASSGLGVIELGHDVSEFPLCDILGGVVAELVGERRVIRVPERAHWHSPKSHA